MDSFINIDLDVIEINNEEIRCSVCGSVMETLSKEMTLQDHLMTIIGFKEIHKAKCGGNNLPKIGFFKLCRILFENDMYLAMVDNNSVHIMEIKDECLTDTCILWTCIDTEKGIDSIHESIIEEMEALISSDPFEVYGFRKLAKLFKEYIYNYDESLF
jgi:hypothetical protein